MSRAGSQPPPSSESYFDLFGLPPRYALSKDELEARYRELSRTWHPDRHGRAPAAERLRVLQRATDLNEAYRVLRSDPARASYLLKLQGIDLDREGGGGDQPKAAPAFLMEILELREALAEAKAAGDEARVRGLDSDVRGRSERTAAAVAAAFLRAEAGERAALPEIAAHLIALRYYQRFHDEIEAYEEARLSP